MQSNVELPDNNPRLLSKQDVGTILYVLRTTDRLEIVDVIDEGKSIIVRSLDPDMTTDLSCEPMSGDREIIMTADEEGYYTADLVGSGRLNICVRENGQIVAYCVSTDYSFPDDDYIFGYRTEITRRDIGRIIGFEGGEKRDIYGARIIDVKDNGDIVLDPLSAGMIEHQSVEGLGNPVLMERTQNNDDSVSYIADIDYKNSFQLDMEMRDPIVEVRSRASNTLAA